MKKIILGLLLTAGVSGICYGNNQQKEIVISEEGCTYTLITNTVDSNGVLLGTTSQTSSVPCGNNAPGTVIIEQKLVIKPAVKPVSA